MSLINKMLRDLDARRGGEGERAALTAAVTPLVTRKEPSRAWPILSVGGLIILATLGGVTWYGAQLGSPEIPGAAAPTAAVPKLPKPPAAPAPEAPLPIPASPAIADAPVSAAIVAPAPTDPVGAALPASATGVAVPSLRLDDALLLRPKAIADPLRKEVSTVPKAVERPATKAVPSMSGAAAVPKARAAVAETRIEMQVRHPSASERAEADYRRGLMAQRLGNADEAAGIFSAALANYPEHAAARQMLAALLIEARRFDEAEELLRKGTELPAVRLASTLALARLKVERNQAGAALELLQTHATAGERSADYQGFAGALLNRAGRTAEAIEHYQAATRLSPGEGRWWAGLGIALDAAGRGPDAREAYQRARALPGLPADLAQHIDQRLH